MIHRNCWHMGKDELIGKFIFHLSDGGIPLIGNPPFNAVKIGRLLGKVVEITSPNRIFYTTFAGDRHYVSLRGIGFACDTQQEAEELESLRNRGLEMFQAAMTELSQWIESELDNIGGNSEKKSTTEMLNVKNLVSIKTLYAERQPQAEAKEQGDKQ